MVQDVVGEPIRVLLVEDDPTDVDLICRVLARFHGARFVVSAVDRLGHALAHVATQRTDVVLLDMTLPDGSGLPLLSVVLRSLPEIPVVVLTGSNDRSLPLDTVKMGAQDFLQKEHIPVDERLPRALLFAIERRRWQTEMEKSRLELEEAQAIAHVGSWRWEMSTDQVSLSKELCRLHGLGRREATLPYPGFLELIHAEDRARSDASFRDAAGSLAPVHCEYRVLLPGGQTRTLLGQGQAITDAAGVVRSVAGSAQDVTEAREREVQLLAAGRMAAVGVLAAGVAHEINNPLASILGNLQFLSRQRSQQAGSSSETTPLVPGERTVIADLQDSAQRIRAIVEKLMMLSDVEMDAVTEINVRTLLEHVLDLVGNVVRERAQLTREYEETPLVAASEGRLAHAFVQLLINAAEAIPVGSPDKHEVRVRTSTDREGRVVVEIQDDGVGIPADIRARIFDPFFTTKPIHTATGLGLSTAHAMVTSSGGRLVVESEKGEGSTFRVLLPPARFATAIARKRRTAEVEQSTILIVDDDPRIGHMLRRLLARDYDVIVATDAASAEAQLVQTPMIDLIVCDILMPETSGIDLFERLKRTSPRAVERMIFMTGGTMTGRTRAFIERLDATCLKKPFDAETLLTTVRDVLGRADGSTRSSG